MPKPVIFVSHISEEAKLATIIKERLERDYLGMIDVFVSSDKASITVGHRWLNEVSGALENAKALLVLCSPLSVQRPWVQFESGAGWVNNIPAVPICHSGLTPSGLPIPLNLLQGIVATDRDGWGRLYSLIAEQLGSRVPSPNIGEFLSAIEDFEADFRDTLKREAGRVQRVQYRAWYYLADHVRKKIAASPELEGLFTWELKPDTGRMWLHTTRTKDEVPFSVSVPVEADWPEGATIDYAQRLANRLMESLHELARKKDEARGPEVS
jgi:hypothetical protein